jgi:hypothetical protein
MPYRTMGWIHANIARIASGQSGQGTVEYVGLILLLAGLLTGVVIAARSMRDGGGLAKEIADKLKSTIESIGAGRR